MFFASGGYNILSCLKPLPKSKAEYAHDITYNYIYPKLSTRPIPIFTMHTESKPSIFLIKLHIRLRLEPESRDGTNFVHNYSPCHHDFKVLGERLYNYCHKGVNAFLT